MRTYNRICIKDYTVKDEEGTTVTLYRGKEYLTSPEEEGEVMVFTNYWFKAPVEIFAGEQVFTK